MRLFNLVAVFGALLAGLAGCADYGEAVEFGKSTVYYKDGATADDARRLGEYLEKSEVFDDEKQDAAQVSLEKGTYVVRLVARPGMKFDDEDMLLILRLLRAEIEQEVFPGKTVRLEFTDENCKTLKAIEG